MTMIQCPECGTRISETATICPYCGYMGKIKRNPISSQAQYEIVPMFKYDIEKWEPNRGDLVEIPANEGRRLFSYFGVWKNIEMKLPAIADAIKSLAHKESYMVADYDEYVAKLIEKGIYKFTVDKNGEILPTIKQGGKIVKQVRLKEMNFSPQLNQALNNLAIYAQLGLILDEIECIGDEIRNIHQELQNDRIALSESAWDKLNQARKMQDARMREATILNAVNTATDAKRIIMRNFADNKRVIEESNKKSTLDKFFSMSGEKDIPIKAADAFQDIVSITNCVQVECEGFAMLGEYAACKESLIEFRAFILDNSLDNRDTLLLLNSSSNTKQGGFIDEFSKISKRIVKFNIDKAIDYSSIGKLEDVKNA